MKFGNVTYVSRPHPKECWYIDTIFYNEVLDSLQQKYKQTKRQQNKRTIEHSRLRKYEQ
jgi:hypothetical protein